MTWTPRYEVDAALVHLAREESGRVLALLARRFGDLDLADEAVQEGLIEAARVWPSQGVPSNPASWLFAVSRRKAIDQVRRASSAYRRTMSAAPELLAQSKVSDPVDDGEGSAMIVDEPDESIGDERLRLMLLCCHPALDSEAQVALTLRLAAGLTTREIAAAFLVPEATLAQRIVRAKRKIRDAGMPLAMPSNLGERLGALLAVLYLVFNEGYLSRSDGGDAVRVDLIDEAVRLTHVVDRLLPGQAEVEGLLALELFNKSRLTTRTDHLGDLVLLEHQDRARWDLGVIDEANLVLRRAMARMRPGPYQMQALIAGHHANARTAADTDWPKIAQLYGQLTQMSDSPVIRLNHAAAIAVADGPHAGLALLAELRGLDNYHLFHATRGELLLRAGHPEAAATAFETARSLTTSPVEQRHLERRLAAAHQD